MISRFTFTGRQVDVLNPQVDEIDILDVAHGLALQCRFSGQISQFYSVAQHSVMVSRLVPDEDALWGLLHDASEAYLCDIPAPLKRSTLLTGYRMIERRVMGAVAECFRLQYQMPASVKEADRIALATEFRDLRLCSAEGAARLAGAWPAPARIIPLRWQDAQRAFLDRYHELAD